ncbi:5' nucleotidase, NT5C type [Rhodococcus sp. NPDC003994]
MATIGIDLDGVLYDFGTAIADYYSRAHGVRRDTLPAPTHWHFYRDWGLTDDDFRQLCNDAADARQLWERHIVHRDDNIALRRLRDAGHRIHIITARDAGTDPAITRIATIQWLYWNDVPHDNITFSKDKTVVTTDWFLEDNVGNYDALDAAGSRPVLIDRAWNQDADHPRFRSVTRAGGCITISPPTPRRRVTTVTEFAELLLANTPAPATAGG